MPPGDQSPARRVNALDAPTLPIRVPGRLDYLHGFDLMRVVAAVLVAYGHIAGWLAANEHDWAVRGFLDSTVVETLRLNNLMGFTGVGTFLVISGFVITYVATKETPGQFLLRRAFRLLPALWLTVTLAWLLYQTSWVLHRPELGPGDLWANLFMVNFFDDQWFTLVAVAWTLLVQFTFYLFVAATIPLGRRHPWLPPALAISVVSVLLSLVNTTDSLATAQLRTVITFLPVVFLGQLVSLVRSGLIPVALGTVFGILQFLLFVRAGLTNEGIPAGEAHARTLVLVVVITVLMMGANGRLVRSSWIATAAKRTYSVFLTHIPVAYTLLGLLTPRTSLFVALSVTVVAVVVVSELVYRLVEVPVYRWYRRRERFGRPRTAVPGRTGT
ncbi:acyltransferase family protein [Actinoalloteichus spitiensis]|uniref:acyltransferase family protein n=1 Tax=Actinoalloteichus spitiensis TaxID=252394 RepID=UPI0012F65213|nr:acyltransferase [Actinoalloteichus spitiensis]